MLSVSAELLSCHFRLRRKGFDLRVAEAIALEGVTAVFGPSGSGKTTLLRCIAGLDVPEEGGVRLGDQDWARDGRTLVKPQHRRVGLVFQDGRLFQHLSVEGNLDYADRRSRKDGNGISVGDVVEATGITPLLKRPVEGLSGGETRRVALARAIVSRPRLLLLDEPLSGLDRAARRELLPYLRDLPERFGIPALFVSHDIEEVTALADRVLVLQGGTVTAHGPIGDVLNMLDLAPLTDGARQGSVVEAVVRSHDPGLGVTQVDLKGQALHLPLNESLAENSVVRLFVDARDVSIALTRPTGLSIRNILPVRITALSPEAGGVEIDLSVLPGTGTLKSRITRAALRDLDLVVGQEVFALIKSVSLAGQNN
jgi:molybdate transport system ATP-binding protein